MFGLLMAFLHLGAKTAVGIKYGLDENKSKERAIKNGRDFYIDKNGCQRRLSNGEPFMLTTDLETGHTIEINPYNRKVYRDVTADYQRQYISQSSTKAKQDGREFYVCEENSWYKHLNDKIKGARYKNVFNNEMYVRRRISNTCTGGVPWYLNLRTGMFEATEKSEIKSDSSYEDVFTKKIYNYKTNEDIEALKQMLNERQKDNIKNNGFNSTVVWMNGREKVWDIIQ